MPRRTNAAPGVQKRGSKWRARAFLDGREVSKTFASREEAVRWKREQERSFERGEWIDPQSSSIKFDDWAESWLQTKTNLTPSTLRNYETRLRTLLRPHFGALKITAITHNEISKWIAKMIDEGKGLVSIRQAYGVLRQILGAAVLDGRLTRNPAIGVPLPRIKSRRKSALDASQLRLLADSCGEFGLLILFAGTTGLRWGEIAALRCKDISMLNRTVLVEKSIARGVNGWVVGSTKTHSVRTIPFPRELAKGLEDLIASKSPESSLFAMPGGGALEYNNFMTRHFRPAVKESGLGAISFHSLRHTAASLLIAQGTPITTVSGILGHASTKMTLDVYGHFYKGDALLYMDRLGESLFIEPANERPSVTLLPSTSHG